MVEENESADELVECEVYSRIVGYVRPVKNWNKGKKQEYEERQEYNVDVHQLAADCVDCDSNVADGP